MTSDALARWWMLVSGAAMVLMAGLAAADTRLVGAAPSAMLRMNTMHGAVHALGGLLTIAAGLLLRGNQLANAAIAYGVLFAIGFAVNLASPDLFGMMPDAPANAGVHVMHATVAAASLLAGYRARKSRTISLAPAH